MHILVLLATLVTGPKLEGTHAIRIDGFIDDTLVTTVLNVMEKLPAEIRVTINSPGGSVSAAESITNIFMFARANGVQIRCLVTGRAMSAAFWILESCSERMATPDSKFMTHSPYIVARGEIVLTIPDLTNFLEDLTQDERQLANVIAPRMGMTPSAFLTKLRATGMEGWRMDAHEALTNRALDSLFMGDANLFSPKATVNMCTVDV